MNLQTKMPTTADEFLRWNEGREGKREFVRGRVVEMMINVTRLHARLAFRLQMQLGAQIDTTRFDIGSADLGVRTNDGVRYPDVYVDTAQGDPKDLTARAPLLLVEILSTSSHDRDLDEKVADYTDIPSLLHYLVLSQDEPRAWHWSRVDQGEWTGPALIAGDKETVNLHGLGATIRFGELYAGVFEQPH
jgi:Uma2 family endonuclease